MPRDQETRGAEYSAVCKLVPFNLDNGSTAVYLEHMELYSSANSVPEAKQVP